MEKSKKWMMGAAVVLTIVFGPTLSVQAQGSMPRQGRYYVEPGGWVRLGIDYDNDGTIDRYQYIYGEDLIEAQKKTEERIAGTYPLKEKPGYRPGYYLRERSMSRRGEYLPGRMDMVQGTIEDMKGVDLSGMEQKHLLARIRTPEGRTARVDLGPVGSLSRLDLQEGDRVTVYGQRGNINDRGVLIVHRIRAGDRTVDVWRPGDRGMRRYSGRILQVRTASFMQHDVPDQVIARVRLSPGVVTAVNLGPRNQLQDDLNINELEGRHIELLAHRARIGNKTALVADELFMNGRRIEIDWSRT